MLFSILKNSSACREYILYTLFLHSDDCKDENQFLSSFSSLQLHADFTLPVPAGEILGALCANQAHDMLIIGHIGYRVR